MCKYSACAIYSFNDFSVHYIGGRRKFIAGEQHILNGNWLNRHLWDLFYFINNFLNTSIVFPQAQATWRLQSHRPWCLWSRYLTCRGWRAKWKSETTSMEKYRARWMPTWIHCSVWRYIMLTEMFLLWIIYAFSNPLNITTMCFPIIEHARLIFLPYCPKCSILLGILDY